MVEVRKYLWYSQIFLIGFLLVCCVIMPSVAIRNGGVSNFGNHISTVAPYIAGFLLSTTCLSMAAYKLLKLSPTLLKMACLLFGLSLLNLLVLCSTFPRHIAWTYSVIHDDLGITLVTYELCLAVWMVVKRKTISTSLFLLIESLGSLISLLSILKIIHFLFIGQFLSTIGFGLLLATAFSNIVGVTLTERDSS